MATTTRVVSVRLPNDLIDAINAAMASANRPRFEEPYTFNSWVISAVKEKLAKLARAKKSGQNRRKGRKAGQGEAE